MKYRHWFLLVKLPGRKHRTCFIVSLKSVKSSLLTQGSLWLKSRKEAALPGASPPWIFLAAFMWNLSLACCFACSRSRDLDSAMEPPFQISEEQKEPLWSQQEIMCLAIDGREELPHLPSLASFLSLLHLWLGFYSRAPGRITGN